MVSGLQGNVPLGRMGVNGNSFRYLTEGCPVRINCVRIPIGPHGAPGQEKG